jgi:hypothetical protein
MNMPRKIIFVDIDETLLVNAVHCRVSGKNKNHLTQFNMPYHGKLLVYYAINLLYMAKIFRAMQAENIEIAFITNADYRSKEFLPCLEKLYQLEPGSLKNCIFINIFTFAYGAKKCYKISRVLELIHEKFANVIVVDDSSEHIAGAQDYGYETIRARGFSLPINKYPEDISVDHSYLEEIVRKCGLKINHGDDTKQIMLLFNNPLQQVNICNRLSAYATNLLYSIVNKVFRPVVPMF